MYQINKKTSLQLTNEAWYKKTWFLNFLAATCKPEKVQKILNFLETCL